MDFYPCWDPIVCNALCTGEPYIPREIKVCSKHGCYFAPPVKLRCYENNVIKEMKQMVIWQQSAWSLKLLICGKDQQVIRPSCHCTLPFSMGFFFLNSTYQGDLLLIDKSEISKENIWFDGKLFSSLFVFYSLFFFFFILLEKGKFPTIQNE